MDRLLRRAGTGALVATIALATGAAPAWAVVPDAPAKPTISAGDAQITVNFGAPADNGNPITGYTASCSNGGAPVTNTGSGSPIIVGSLTNGNTYTCNVTATNSDGPSGVSPDSDPAIPAAVPNAPAAPGVAAGNAQITVTFGAPANNGSGITGYTASCNNGGSPVTNTGSGSPIIVGGLTNGSAYTCTVTATNGVGTSSPSSPSGSATPAGPPSAPATPTVAFGNQQVTVTFGAPANNGSTITGYTASCNNGGSPVTNTGSGSPIIVGGLTNGSAYTCTVTATNGVGTSSPSSPSGSATPAGPPSAPATPTVAFGNQQVTVTFGAPANNGSAITGYTASCNNGGSPVTNTGSGSPIIVGGLTNGSAYTCTVTATNGVGTSSPSSPSGSATPATVPNTPAMPTVAAGNAQITVTFSAPANNGSAITSYTALCYSTDVGAASSSISGPASPLVVLGLTNGHPYTCFVSTFNGAGESPTSVVSSAVNPGPPNAPVAPTVARAGSGALVVAFVASAANASAITGYTASCTSSDGGAAGSMTGTASPITVASLTNGKTYTCTVTATNSVGTGSASPVSPAIVVGIPATPAAPTVSPGSGRVVVAFVAPADNGSAITGYAATCTSSDGGAPGTDTGTITPITVSGLTNGKTYTCTVTATNGAGTSALSGASATVVPNLVPDAPGPASVVAGNAQIVVSFSAPDGHGYAISGYTAVCTSTNGGALGSVVGTASPITVTALTNAKTYTCAVTATNIIGTGAPSPASVTAVPFTIAAPPSVDNVAIGNAAVTVSFTANANNGAAITGFTVTCYSSRGGGFTGTTSGASSPIVVSGLSNGWAYICEVTATNAAGVSGPSDPSPAVSVGAPAPPQIVSVVPALAKGSVGDLKVYFRPGSDNGSKIIQYRALCKSVQTGQTRFHDGAGSPIKVPGALTGRAYDCTVFSWNDNGAGSESHAVRAVVGTPSTPRIVRVMRVPHGLALAFLPAASNGSGIRDYRARCTSTDGGVPSAPLQQTSPIVANNLTPGKTYTCELTAINGRGESPPARTAPIVTTNHEVTTGCKGADGSLRVSPGLLFSINKPHTFRLAAQVGHCSGGYVSNAKISMTFRSKAPFSCRQAIGKANAGSGTITWTAPQGLGSSDAAIQLVIGATHGHVTNARFHGTITSRANLYTDHHVSGTLTMTKGLAASGSGGDCSNTSRLQKFTVTSVTLRIS